MIITPQPEFDRVSNSSKQISAHLSFPYKANTPLGSSSPHLLQRECSPGQELTLCSEDRAEGREHSCPCQLPRRALSQGFPLHPGSRPRCSSPIYFLLPSLGAGTRHLVEKLCSSEATWSPSTEVTATLRSCPCSHVGTHGCGRGWVHRCAHSMIFSIKKKKGNWERAEHHLLLQPYPSIWAEVVVGFPSLVGTHGMNTSAPNTGLL